MGGIMPCKVVFTCVPMGMKDVKPSGNTTAVLDVLAVPHCDDVNSILDLFSWADSILACRDKFTVNGNVSLKLITNYAIEKKLWKTLFGDAVASEKSVRPTPIAPFGVNLDTTHQLCHKFYEAANGRAIDVSRNNPDLEFLHDLHTSSIEQHGLYAPAPSSAIKVHITDTRKNLGESLRAAGGGPDEANADALIRARFGVQPPVTDQTTGVPICPVIAIPKGPSIQPPAAAVDALAALKLDLVASFKTASNEKEPRYKVSSFDRPPHLLYHVNRAIVSAAGKKVSHATQVAHDVFSRAPYGFNQRITMLLNMPALLEALGLVLHFELPWDKASTLKSAKLDIPSDLIAQTKIEPHPRTTITNSSFLPAPKPGSTAILPNGWINPSDGYRMGSLQLDSSAMQITQFSSQAGLRQAGDPNHQPVLTVSYDEDVDHPILYPSPHTGGLYVWQHQLQDKVNQHRIDAEVNRNDDSKPLYAEDLRNGVVVDVVAYDPTNSTREGTWVHLCRRDEEFNINGTKITRRGIDRAVKTAALRSVDPAATAPLSHDVDETVFTWRLGSLVAKSRLSNNPMKSKTPVAMPSEESKQVPWKKLGKPKLTPAISAVSPIFGWQHRVAMRAGFVTGGVVPFTETDALKAALPRSSFHRYELIQGPAVIPVTITENYLQQQSPTLMFVGSHVNEDLSLKKHTTLGQRLIVPPRVTPEVAQRHGKEEARISRGATVLPLNNGALPNKIDITTEPSQDTSGTYVPDPMCIGVTAVLGDLDGKVHDTKSLSFYSNALKDWPDYIPHMIQMEWTADSVPSLTIGRIDRAAGTMPFLSRDSRAFVCRIPPGQTYLLTLRPQVDPLNIENVHALALSTKATRVDGTLDVMMLSFSDICRPTTVRLTHATDRPIKKPEVTMDPTLPANHHASVGDPISVKLGSNVEHATTSKVALLACWSEITDDRNQRSYNKKILNSQFTEFPVPKRVLQKSQNPNVIVPTHIQFPFSDNRYRRVTVTARGTARYGDLFDQDAKQHTVDSNPITLDVLATTKPTPPDIEYVLPNLSWDIGEKKRTRTMGLTIVLNRPWFSSGIGEQLAIITSRRTAQSDPIIKSIATSMPANTENSVSAWGVLADWKGCVPDGAPSKSIDIFEDTQRVHDDDDAAPSPELPNYANIQIGGQWYSALFFSPRFNHQDQQWFVNLRLAAPPAYGSVLRLLVARYQQNAIDGEHISDISMCDFSLLRPERSVTINTTGWGLSRKTQVRILGYGPQCSDGAQLPKTLIEVRYFETDQTRPQGFEWADGDVVESESLPSNSDVLWQATVPNPILGGGGTLVAHEYEIWPSAENPKQSYCLPAYFDILPL